MTIPRKVFDRFVESLAIAVLNLNAPEPDIVQLHFEKRARKAGRKSYYASLLNGETISDISRRIGISRPTIYHAIKESRYINGIVVPSKVGRPRKG